MKWKKLGYSIIALTSIVNNATILSKHISHLGVAPSSLTKSTTSANLNDVVTL
jgi:hypothetical protein